VNLLLLLSALLSALTGAGVAARAPQVAVAVSRTAVTAATPAVVPARRAGLPVMTLPVPADVAAIEVAPAWRLAPAAPLYLSRRRE
jgi:hypothetical protein